VPQPFALSDQGGDVPQAQQDQVHPGLQVPHEQEEQITLVKVSNPIFGLKAPLADAERASS